MPSNASRWPGDDTPLSAFHGGNAKAAMIAVKRAKRKRCVEVAKEIISADFAASKSARKDRRRPRVVAKPAKPKAMSKSRQCRHQHRHRKVEPLASRNSRVFRNQDVCNEQRMLLHAAQDGLCGICGAAMDGVATMFSLDHVIPLSERGQDRVGNLMLTHGECNGEKSNDLPTGCEMVMLLAVNARLGVKPDRY